MKQKLTEAKTRPQKRNQRDYSMGFKLSVISQVEKGELTYKQAQDRYGIQGRSTVLCWLRKHGNLDWSNPTIYSMPQPKRKLTPAEQIKKLETELNEANSAQQELLFRLEQSEPEKIQLRNATKAMQLEAEYALLNNNQASLLATEQKIKEYR